MTVLYGAPSFRISFCSCFDVVPAVFFFVSFRVRCFIEERRPETLERQLGTSALAGLGKFDLGEDLCSRRGYRASRRYMRALGCSKLLAALACLQMPLLSSSPLSYCTSFFCSLAPDVVSC